MANIIIRIAPRDAVIRAWHEAVPELSSTSRNEIVKSVIRAEKENRPFCAGRLHKSRLTTGTDRAFSYNIYYDASKCSDIQEWRDNVSSLGYSATSLLKAYLVRHIEIVDDDESEYIPDILDCINSTGASPVREKSPLAAQTSPATTPIKETAAEDEESVHAPVASSEAHTDAFKPAPKNEKPAAPKGHGSFAGLGGARRRD